MSSKNKQEVKEKIESFFRDIKSKSRDEIKEIKELAMKHNIRLGEKRKKFCQYCYSPSLKVKAVKKGMKTIKCIDCGKVSRWEID